jgi:hypothetical protein
MSEKPKAPAAKKKPSAAVETSQTIEEQTAAFLKAGGTIEKINSGVSGQPSIAGSKHITIGNNKPQLPRELPKELPKESLKEQAV